MRSEGRAGITLGESAEEDECCIVEALRTDWLRTVKASLQKVACNLGPRGKSSKGVDNIVKTVTLGTLLSFVASERNAV